jgi:hypothetical protein
MSVYVDSAKHHYRRMIMCHMMADTPAELHKMAGEIGVALRHFQTCRYDHYDICKQMRARAVELGAVEISTKDMIRKFKPPPRIPGMPDRRGKSREFIRLYTGKPNKAGREEQLKNEITGVWFDEAHLITDEIEVEIATKMQKHEY